MIKLFKHTKEDKDILNSLNIDYTDLIKDDYDYSKEKILKPWGYEYQIYADKEVAIWILHIDSNQKTSFHCHPNKQTTLKLLSKERILCRNLLTTEVLFQGDIIEIDKGVFHQTIGCGFGAIIMEVEIPNNKNDLIRYQDIYGRV